MGKKIKSEKLCKNETPVSKRVVAFCILVSYCLVLAPAKEFLMERDNADSFIERYEIEKENLSEEEKSAVESALKGEVVCDDVFWGEYQSDGTLQTAVYDSMLLIHKSKLYEMLLDVKKRFVEEKRESDDVESFEKEWKEKVEKIIEDYLKSLGFSDGLNGKVELVSEFSDMERKLYNEALSEFLYDHYSMKKEADENAAGTVTEKLIAEVESDTQNNLDVLFNRLNKVSDYEESDLKIERDNWFESFQKYIDEGIEKWNEVETEFLEAKYAFENEAGEKYEKDIEKWADAYDELIQKRDEWNKNIEEKIEEGIVIWNQKSEKFEAELNNVMEDYKNELLAEYRQKSEAFRVNCEIYTQTRSLLSTACSEVENWLGVWAGKYDGIYSYWKTEDEKNKVNYGYNSYLSGYSNEDELENPLTNYLSDSLTDYNKLNKDLLKVKDKYEKTVKKIKSYSQKDESLENDSLCQDILKNSSVLISELDLVLNWVDIISEYSKTLDDVVLAIKETGFDYSDDKLVFCKDESERSRLLNELSYWNDEKEIAYSVLEYSRDNTSKVENLKATKENLEISQLKSEDAREEYEDILLEVENARIDYENNYRKYQEDKLQLDEILKKLQECQVDYKVLKADTSDIYLEELKSDYLTLVNSINMIKPADETKYCELFNLMEKNGYSNINQNVQKLIDLQYSSHTETYEDENGKIVERYVIGLAELEKRNENTLTPEERTLYHTKKETVCYLQTGTFSGKAYADVDYSVIVTSYKSVSAGYYQVSDSAVKKQISEEIEKILNNDKDWYLTCSDEELWEWFSKVNEIYEKNFCSDFIKLEVDFFQKDILNARLVKNIESKRNELSDEINEIEGISHYINTLDFNAELYKTLFENAGTFDDQIIESDEYNKEYSKIAEEINRPKNDYEKYLRSLNNVSEKIIAEDDRLKSFYSKLDVSKKEVEVLENQYNQALEKCNGSDENSSFSLLKSSLSKYQQISAKAYDKYDELEKLRHYEDICREIYNWAENEYLHLEYDGSESISLEERYQNAIVKCEEIEDQLSIFDLKKEERSEYCVLLNENGENVFNDLSNATKNYCASQVFLYEIESKLNKQLVKLNEAQYEEVNYFYRLVKETDENSIEFSEILKKYVKFEKAENDDNVVFRIVFNDEALKSDGLNDCQSLLSDDCRKYLVDKTVEKFNFDDSVIYISQSESDAADFLISLCDKPFTIDDILLAVFYLKMQSDDESLFLDGENPENDANYSLGSISDELYGIHIKDIYHSSRMQIVENAWKKVFENNGLDDLAKFLFYSNFNFSELCDFKNRGINYVAKEGMNELISELLDNESDYTLKGDASFVLSIALTVLSCVPWCSWASALAATATITAATMYRTADDLKDCRKDVEEIQKGYDILFNESVRNSDWSVNGLIESSEKSKMQLEKTYSLLYANTLDTKKSITFEDYDKAIKELLGDEESSIDYSYLSNMYVNNSNIDSFEMLFNLATEGKECHDVLEVSSCISEYINSFYYQQIEQTEKYANIARLDENWNESLYQREFGRISYDNLIYQVPFKLNREQETYFTQGFTILSECYDNMLSEYYSNLLEQKKNEIDIKKRKYSDQIEQWQLEMTNVVNVGQTEWQKAEEQFYDNFDIWNNKWVSAYKEIEDNWNRQYEEILLDKANWINQNYTEQALMAGIETGENLDLKLEDIKHKAEEIVQNENDFIVPLVSDVSLNSLKDIASFDDLLDAASSMNMNALKYSIDLFSSDRNNVFESDKADLVSKTIDKVNSSIEDAVLLKSADITLNSINERIEQFYKQIEVNNKNIEQWEKELVLKDGYTYGDEIYRYAIVNSLVFAGNIREKQTVHKYEYFNCVLPNLAFSINYADDPRLLSLLIQRSLDDINRWHEKVFGNGEDLGLFAKHVGEGPEFVSNVNTKKNRVENISKAGFGQMSLIMLDFMWNSFVNRDGYAELGTPLYEKKFTKDNVICGIQIPTLKDITSVICDIIGNATGQAWVSMIDDIAFGIMDLNFERKSVDQVVGGIAKAGVSMGIGAAASGAINTIGSKVTDQMSKTLLTAGVKTAQSYSNAVAGSYIDAISFEDGFSIDWDRANSVWTNEDVLKSAFSSGVTYGINTSLNTVLNNYTLTDGLNRRLDNNVFNTSPVVSLNKTISTVAAAGVERILTGKTKVNLLSVANTGLFEVEFSNDGITAGLGTAGLDLNVFDALYGLGGIDTVLRVTDAKKSLKHGDEKKITMLNAVNCLTYSNYVEPAKLAKDIWDGKKIVNIKDMNALGRTDGNVIEISDKLVGNNDEAAVLVASTILHEDAHATINADEFKARLIGYDFYNEMSQSYNTSEGMYDNVSDIGMYSHILNYYGNENLFYILQLGKTFEQQDDGWEYYLAETYDPKWRQNMGDNYLYALGDAITKKEVDRYNNGKVDEAYEKYMKDGYKEYINQLKQAGSLSKDKYLSYEDFCNSGKMQYEDKKVFKTAILTSSKDLEAYHFNVKEYISLFDSGCVLSTAAYIIYSLTGKLFSLQEANRICKEKGVFDEAKIPWGGPYVNAVNALAGEEILTEFNRAINNNDKNQLMNDVMTSEDAFFVIARVVGNSHAVLVKSQQTDCESNNGTRIFNSLDVINSWKGGSPDSKLGASNYKMSEINNLTSYKVNPDYIDKYKKLSQYREQKIKEINSLYNK